MERQTAPYCKLIPLHEAEEQLGVAETTRPTLGNREDARQ